MPQSFSELLAALQGPAAVGAVLWAASWGLEEFAFWQNLPSKTKSLAVLFFSIALGLFAVWFSSYPELIAKAEPYVKAVLYITGAWLGTQVAHRKDEKAMLLSYRRQLDEAPTEDKAEPEAPPAG